MNEVNVAAFSGGRSSAMMVHRILENKDPLDHIIFCNTGMESPATYEFLRACDEMLFDNKLTMLEYVSGNVKGERAHKVVSHDTQSKDGSPFKQFIHDSTLLPGVWRRACTNELKLKTKYKYLYGLGHDYKTTYINFYLGFRNDEPSRIARMNAMTAAYEKRIAEGKRPLKWTSATSAPLADAKITRNDVIAYWQSKPLGEVRTKDLLDKGIDPADPSLLLSNCAGCFFSNDAEMFRVAREHPDITANWIEMESISNNKIKSERPVPEYRHKWVRKYLNRNLKEKEYHEASFYGYATWKQIKEAAFNTNDLFGGEVPIAGGCSDGECGVDL